MVASNLGTAALWAGRLELAERYFTAAVEVRPGRPRISQLNAAAYHALLRCERGELGPAEVGGATVIDISHPVRPRTGGRSPWAPT